MESVKISHSGIKLGDILAYDPGAPECDLIVVGICPQCYSEGNDHIQVAAQCGTIYQRLSEDRDIWHLNDIVMDNDRKVSAVKAFLASDYEDGQIMEYLHWIKANTYRDCLFSCINRKVRHNERY